MATTQSLFLAKIQARSQNAHGRFYPVELQFKMYTQDGVIGTSLLHEGAIAAANDAGWEVHHVETVNKITDL